MSMLMRVLVSLLMLCLQSSAADCPAGKLAEENEVTSLLQVQANMKAPKLTPIKECVADDTPPNNGYQVEKSGHTRVFWSKNSCMTVLYCLDSVFLSNNGYQGPGEEGPAMGRVGASKFEGGSALSHATCASRNNFKVKADEVFKQPGGLEKERTELSTPGCTQWMSHFMEPFRQKLLVTHKIDLYADFGDKQLICENTVAKQFEWGSDENEASTVKQLAILKAGVMKADVFAYFDENKGRFCDAEEEAGKDLKVSMKGSMKKLDWQGFLKFAETFLTDKGMLRKTAPPDGVEGGKIEAEFGGALADWFAQAIK